VIAYITLVRHPLWGKPPFCQLIPLAQSANSRLIAVTNVFNGVCVVKKNPVKVAGSGLNGISDIVVLNAFNAGAKLVLLTGLFREKRLTEESHPDCRAINLLGTMGAG